MWRVQVQVLHLFLTNLLQINIVLMSPLLGFETLSSDFNCFGPTGGFSKCLGMSYLTI